MAAGRDPQSLILDHLMFVQMGGGRLSEPIDGGIIQDGAHDGFILCHQIFGRETPARAFMMLRALEAH